MSANPLRDYSADPVAEFRQAIAAAGLTAPDHIEADGKLHRFRTGGSGTSGYYTLHLDGLPAGHFGDWRSGHAETWRANIGRPLTTAEHRENKARIAAMKKQREAAEAEQRAKARERAAAIWHAAEPATDHAHLQRKGVKAHGLRVHDGLLTVPLHADGALQSLQFIKSDGEKRFLTGGRTAGCYFMIGDPGATVCIAEGYATAASIHEAAGYACAVAFSAGNLQSVAKTIKTDFPTARLIVCADNDATAGNPGLTAAKEAARATGAGLAVPPTFGDFNDMHQASGLEAVREAIAAEQPTPTTPLQPEIDDSAPLDAARHFVAIHHRHATGSTLHYVQGDFYAWTGTHYARLSVDAARAALYAWLETGCTPRKRLVDEVLDALKAVCHLDARPPQWIGEPVCSGDPIAVKNGLLHVPTRTLYPPNAGFFNLSAAPFSYQPDTPEPEAWLAFIESLWPDDAEARETLQEIFGLMLTTDTSHQKIILLIGPKRGGKGTIARILRALLGTDNTCSPTLAGLGQNFGLASLIGKPLAIISDARLSGRSDLAAVTENLLRISGEDAVSVPRKFQGDWVGQLPTRFLMLTNELPALLDSSGALASRFLILPLTESFYGREDRTLTESLLAELPGIFNWSLAGLDRLATRGHLLQPASGAAMADQLDRLSSPIKAFVSDECALDPAAEILCAALFDAWERWCQSEHRERLGTLQMFGRNLSAAFPQIALHRPRSSSGERQRVYAGIRLLRHGENASGPRWSADLSIARIAREGKEQPSVEATKGNVRGPSRTGDSLDGPNWWQS